MAYLEIRKGKALLQSLLDDEAMSLGRLPGNSIVINDPDISRRHCVIEQWQGKYSIYDLGSRNGTKVNGQAIQRAELKDGDVITIGTTSIKFVEAPMRASAAAMQRSRLRVATWAVGVLVLLTAAVFIGWVTGALEDDLGWSRVTAMFGDGSDDRDEEPVVGSPARPNDPELFRSPNGVEINGDRAPATAPASGAIETSLWSGHYRRLIPGNVAGDGPRLLGRAVAARFVGRPAMNDDGIMIWELPPDGAVTAIFEPSSEEAQRIVTLLAGEPTLLEAELAGRLERDPDGQRLLLRVGVIDVLRAWGGRDESLQPATRRILHQRLILNPRYTAQMIEAQATGQ